MRTITLIALCLLVGCTITPRAVKDSTASFDADAQNSGLVGFLDQGAVITPHARDRFNGLVAIYGNRFIPPLTNDVGITAYTNGTFRITSEQLVNFSVMNSYRKSGK